MDYKSRNLFDSSNPDGPISPVTLWKKSPLTTILKLLTMKEFLSNCEDTRF